MEPGVIFFVAVLVLSLIFIINDQNKKEKK